MSGTTVSVNVSEVRSQKYLGEKVTVAVRVPVRGVDLRGDDQAGRGNHDVAAHGLTLAIMFCISMFERNRLAELLVPEYRRRGAWVLRHVADR